MTVKVLIADDEPLARDILRLWLAEKQGVEVVAECSNGREGLLAIEKTRPDLVLLDIQMPDLDGFGLIRQIGEERMPMVIFVTAFDQYAIDAFKAHAFDYLLKPFDRQRFDEALAAALRQLSKLGSQQRLIDLLSDYEQLRQQASVPRERSRIVVKDSGRIIFVDPKEIHWIEAAGDYVTLHLKDREHLIRETMSGMLAKLAGSDFVRIHRSTIVNRDRICQLEPYHNGEYHVILKSGTRLKLSRGYKDSLATLIGYEL